MQAIKLEEKKSVGGVIQIHQVQPPERVKKELILTPAQAALLPHFFAARDAANDATNAFNRVKRELGLPVFEGEEQTVSCVVPKGRGKVVLAEIQVSARSGYEVKPGWTNKVIDMRPE